MDEEIEILQEDFSVVNDNSNDATNFETIFDNTDEIQNSKENKFNNDLEDKKQKRITKIQIGLILFLVVFASLIYFFGYDFFEPYIKID